MIAGQHHRGACKRAEHAVEAELVHVPLVKEQPTADERPSDPENDVANVVRGFEPHNLAGDEARDGSDDEPTEDRQIILLRGLRRWKKPDQARVRRSARSA
jgi:hypothetical protein